MCAQATKAGSQDSQIVEADYDVVPQAPLASKDGTTNSLTWDRIEGATSYDVRIKFNDNAWTDPGRFTYETNYATWNDLDPGFRSYIVSACIDGECGSYSPESASVETTEQETLKVPDAPEATQSSNDVTLSWKTVPTADNYKVEVSYNGGDWIDVTDRDYAIWASDLSSVTFMGLNAGTRLFRIAACKGTTCTEFSSPSNMVILSETNDGQDSIYKVYRDLNGALYVEYPGTLVLIHSVVTIPVQIDAVRLKIVTSEDGWIVQKITAEQWSSLSLTLTTDYGLEISDLNSDGTDDLLMRGPDSNSTSYVLTSINSTPDVYGFSPTYNNVDLSQGQVIDYGEVSSRLTRWVPTASLVDNDLTLTWNAVPGANRYLVEVSYNNGDWVDVTNREYADWDEGLRKVVYKSLTAGQRVFRIVACNNSDCFKYSELSDVIEISGNGSANPEQAPQISLLSDDGISDSSASVGITAGQFRVDESGSATYQVPIALPSGIAGVTPELSLAYSSQGGNGPLGLGWNLSGISAISRCKQTPERDDRMAGVTETYDDKFCLDGQTLILTSDSVGYGEAGSTYRTEIDSFVEVTAEDSAGNGPASFKVVGKDGSVRYYGGTADSQMLGSDGTTVLNWYLSSQSDNLENSGNTINYCYRNGTLSCSNSTSGTNEVLLDQISYSGHTVSLSYEERTDTRHQYLLGMTVESTLRLTDITVNSYTGRDIASYHLAYDQDSAQSRLNSIVQCNGSETGICLQPLSFKWTETSMAPSLFSKYTNLADETLQAVQPIELNGDGLPDLAYVSKDGNTFRIRFLENVNSSYQASGVDYITFFQTESDDAPKWQVIDLEGDGISEILLRKRHDTKDRWFLYSRKNGMQSTGFSLQNLELSIGAQDSPEQVVFADLNGDGLGDLSYRIGWDNFLRINGPDGFGEAKGFLFQDVGVISASKSTKSESNYSRYVFSENSTSTTPDEAGVIERLIVDMVDEGRTTEVSKAGYAAKAASAGNDVEDQVVRVNIFPSEYSVYDMNGDGLADLLVKVRERVFFEGQDPPGEECEPFIHYYTWRLYNSEVDANGEINYRPFDSLGYSFNDLEHRCSNSTFDLKELDKMEIKVGDINGDGLGDVVYNAFIGKDTWHYLFSNGKEFVTGSSGIEITGVPEAISNKQLIDVNHDGLADFIYYDKKLDAWYFHPSTGEGFGARQFYAHTDINSNVQSAMFIDANANGHPDLLKIDYADNQLDLHLDENDNKPANVIETITNGFGQATTIRYLPMTNNDVYTRHWDAPEKNWGEGSPVFDVIGSGYLVRWATSDNQTVYYRYAGAKMQAGGRGYLGFAKIESSYTPSSTAIVTTTSYHQDFPFTGMPLTTEKTYGEQLLSKASNDLALQPDSQVPYIVTSTEDSYTLNFDGSTTKTATVVTETTQDEWGNVTEMTVTTTDTVGHSKSQTTTNVYGSSASDGRFGRLSSSAVVHSETGKDSIKRHSTFTYDTDSLLLRSETVEATNTESADEQYLTTHYAYDEYGNKTDTWVCSQGISCDESGAFDADNPTSIYRHKEVIYDAAKRYVDAVKNNLFDEQQAGTLYNDQGLLTLVTDANGVVTEHSYDAFGRRYFTRNSLGQGSIVEQAWATEAQTVNAPGITPAYQYVVRTRGPGKPNQWQYYDDRGRQVAQVTQGFAANAYVYQYTEYDDLGRVTAQSTPSYHSAGANWSSTVYDDMNRPITVTTPLAKTTYTYTGLETETTVSDNGYNEHSFEQVKVQEYNAFGQLIRAQDANNQSTYYGYDATGNLVSVKGVDGEKIITRYDDLGRKTSMDDPDKGEWTYKYNALGQLIEQKDAKNQVTEISYDVLGRKVKRTLGGETTTWHYGTAANKQHQLESESQAGFSRLYAYDSYGRPTTTTTRILGQPEYAERLTYDQYGRIFQRFDATGDAAGLRYHYNDQGYLYREQEAREGVNGEDYYTALAMTAQGKVSEYRLGNQSVTNQNYDSFGMLESITGSHQQLYYSFDGLGNLKSRENQNQVIAGESLKEVFTYDDLNRLETVTLNGTQTLDVDYADNGNIKTKSDVKNGAVFHYGSKPAYCDSSFAGPHAVSQVGSHLSYCYDANGNQTKAYDGTTQTRQVQYTAFDKPRQITGGGETTSFAYDTNRNRYKRVHVDASNKETTSFYVGNVEFIQSASGEGYDVKRYIAGYGVQTRYAATGAVDTQYLHKDHLGSIDVITNSDNKLVNKMSFNAFGERRDAGDWSVFAQANAAPSLSGLLAITKRGYTGHEHVDHANIIHMNGRIYDPTLGRFLQADPIVQAPTNSQSLNRYSYVFNNPLSYTDPSGYSAWTKFRDKFLKPVAAIAIGVISGNAALAAKGLTGLGIAMAGGAAAGYVTTGTFNGALTGAFTAAAFYGIGSHFQEIADANNAYNELIGGDFSLNLEGGLTASQAAAKTFSHALAGGVMGSLNGGKFGHGFVSAGFTQALAPSINGINEGVRFSAGRITAAALIGGTASVITGGKFANGAVTGAFSRIFNDEIHWKKRVGEYLSNSSDNTFVIGAGFSAVLGYGVEGSLGVFITPGDFYSFDIGFFVAGGDGFGLNVSADILAGANRGNYTNLQGESLNINALVAGVSVTSVETTASPHNRIANGMTLGYGPTLFPAAFSMVQSTTYAYGRQWLIEKTADGMCWVTGKC